MRSIWHARAYELHIAKAFSHFASVLIVLVDGALTREWEYLDHEYPKLAELVEEVDRTYVIWVVSACTTAASGSKILRHRAIDKV